MIHLQTSEASLWSPNILWDSLLPRSTIVGSTSETNFDVENLSSQMTADGWKPTALPATATFTLASAELVDSIAVVKHTLGSSGSTLNVEYYNGSSWVTHATVVPTDDSNLVVFFDKVLSDQWRIEVTGSTIPFISHVVLCYRLVIPGRMNLPHTPLQVTDEPVLLGSDQSINGSFLPRNIQKRGGRVSLQFWVQAPDFVLETFDGFRDHYNNGLSFVFCSSPAFDSSDFGYCWRPGGGATINPGYRSTSHMNLAMDVQVYHG